MTPRDRAIQLVTATLIVVERMEGLEADVDIDTWAATHIDDIQQDSAPLATLLAEVSEEDRELVAQLAEFAAMFVAVLATKATTDRPAIALWSEFIRAQGGADGGPA